MIGEPLNKTYHYIYRWANNEGELIVKHYYAPSLVEADQQFKKDQGFDPNMRIPAINVQRITN